MSPNTKHIAVLICLAIGFSIEVYGLGMLSGSMGDHTLAVKGAVYSVVGLIIGLPAAIAHFYYSQSGKWFPSKEKVEAETLAALGAKKRR